MIDGIEHLQFAYTTKGNSNTFNIRTDIDEVDVSLIDDVFKLHNCVYPKATVDKDQYTGNRWVYESSVNLLGWKLAWINQEDLQGKRGLIQRAVDSYRNRFEESRSRRVVRQDKLVKGTLRLKPDEAIEVDPTPSDSTQKRKKRRTDSVEFITIEIISHGLIQRIRFFLHTNAFIKRCDMRIDSVVDSAVTDTFKKIYAVLPNDLGHFMNQVSWKLAFLNPTLQGMRLTHAMLTIKGKKCTLQRCVDYWKKGNGAFRLGKKAVEEVNCGEETEINERDESAEQDQLDD